MIIYTVKSGDTLSSIADMFNTSPEFIINTNFPPNPNNLVVGQDFVILNPTETYIVQNGDTVYSIAVKFNTSVNSIYRNNPVIIGRNIYEGEELVIRYDDIPERDIVTNGYAYTNINEQVLLRALPYLTFLTIFTYGFTNNGDLIYTDDERLIELAKLYGAIPTMHLSTLTANGTFSSELAQIILNDENAKNNLISNIIQTMEYKGYGALDVDFEYLPVEDKDNYIEFVSELTRELNSRGYYSLVALAPKTSTNQQGLLYESHDYYGLGNNVNFSLIMTYEWGYSYGPPLAVAPIKNVENVVKYAITQIPPEKTLMGVPLYGYDWNIPYIEGTRATSLSPQRAIEIAAQFNSEIIYDTTSKAPYFYYTDMEQNHIVWFENAKSIDAKMNLVQSYSLAGVGYWSLDRYFPQNWLILNSRFNIAKL